MGHSVVVGTAGHIDHGKSTLVRALTGIDPDRLKEEKERGITIDLGFAHARAGDVQIAFVDVPGHERFVRNMLAGATGIDAVLLVVAADESVMPQTREHFDICRLLGVRAGVIALTKCDAADPETRELARLEVRELVSGSFLEPGPIVEVSAATGEGLDLLREELGRLAARVVPRPTAGPVRLPIDRVFTLRGFGTVITGTLVAGQVHQDDSLLVLPAGKAARVRGLHVHGASTGLAVAGQRVAVNVGDLHVDDLQRGDALVTPGAFDASTRVDARVDLLPGAAPLKHGSRVRFHQGTSETMGRVAVGRVLDAAPGAAGAVPPGRRAYVRLRLESPVVLARGDAFVLRSYSPVATIAGGLVLDPGPRRGPLRSDAARARFDALDPGGAAADEPHALERALDVVVREAGREGLSRPAAQRRLGAGPDAVAAAAERLITRARMFDAADVWLSADVVQRLESECVARVSAHHDAAPDSEGVPREELRDRLRLTVRLFDWLLARLTAAGRLEGRERLAVPGRRGGLSADEQRVAALVERALSDAGLKPPDHAELSQRVAVPAAILERVLAALVRERRVSRVGGLTFHGAALERLKDDVRGMRSDAGTRIDVATFKSRYDLSRKYAIPLLEYLDRERVTRRVGEGRVVL